ncbi:MAG: acyltransferase domain-containing protein, partial [Planctomycetaceae bacterium]
DDAELIHQTSYTQPALFVLEYALAELWRSWGIEPEFVLGHSVGEHVAMVVSGGMSLADGLRLIATRGRLMQALPSGGGMLSVAVESDRIVSRLSEFGSGLTLAAVNAPRQVVVSGPVEQLDRLRLAMEAERVSCRPLRVSHAFHSSLMEPMLDEYLRVASTIEYRKPGIPFISCVLGRDAREEVVRPEYWVAQVRQTVLFAGGLQELDRLGAEVYLEIGPHPPLVTLGTQCLAPRDDRQWLASMRRDVAGSRTLAAALGGLFTAGHVPEWRAIHPRRNRLPTSLPPYPFEATPFWIPKLAATAQDSATCTTAGQARPALGIYRLTWQPLPPRPMVNLPGQKAPAILVVSEPGELAEAVVESLRTGERSVQLVPPPRGEPGIEDWLGIWPESPAEIEVLSLLPCVPHDGNATPHLRRFLGLAQSLARRRRARLWCVTCGATDADPTVPISETAAAFWGFGRTAALEFPDLWSGLLDLDPRDPPSIAASALTQLMAHTPGEDQLAWRSGQVWAARLKSDSPVVGSGSWKASREGTYLITGGTGALGLQLSNWLISRGARHLCLVSRRGIANDSAREA